jgi:hypothetical protein
MLASTFSTVYLFGVPFDRPPVFRPNTFEPPVYFRLLDSPRPYLELKRGKRDETFETMTDILTAKASSEAALLCWICNENEANSGEHKTKRSDLLAVLGKPTQSEPFYYHDLERPNRPVKGLDAEILKSPIRICANCNTARTQPHDQAWEHMSDWLRGHHPPLKVGDLVRGNRIFPHHTRREMRNVHLYFLKLFGCMICEGKANGHEIPIEIAPFSKAIMSNRPHREVYLQFGKCDGTIGRSNLHCWTTEKGSALAGWLYEIDTVAVSVMFAQAGRRSPTPDTWHPLSGSNRFRIVDFQYRKRTG